MKPAPPGHAGHTIQATMEILWPPTSGIPCEANGCKRTLPAIMPKKEGDSLYVIHNVLPGWTVSMMSNLVRSSARFVVLCPDHGPYPRPLPDSVTPATSPTSSASG